MKEKPYNEGEKSQAICYRCKCLASTTFMLRDVLLHEDSGESQHTLAAVCDGCNEVVAIPNQSVRAIHQAVRSRL